MLARKKTSKTGKTIPYDWAEGVSLLLNETYEKQNKEQARYFEVYGQIYPEELLVVVSWLSEKDPSVLPYACFLSCEPHHLTSEEKVKETQKNLIDLAGLFFDEIFTDPEWNEFEPNWQEVSHKHETYFFKISRENINLSLEASRLLGPEFDVDEDEEEEIKH
jgi:hypothetical protein